MKKAAKLLDTIRDFFDESRKRQRDKKDNLKQVLHKLKVKHKDLRKQLSDEDNQNKIKDIQKTIDVIRAQRKKGHKLLKELKKG